MKSAMLGVCFVAMVATCWMWYDHGLYQTSRNLCIASVVCGVIGWAHVWQRNNRIESIRHLWRWVLATIQRRECDCHKFNIRCYCNWRRFDKLCKRLKSNDPAITDVATWFPRCYGNRLAAALESNTMVSAITLELCGLLSHADLQAGTTDGAAPVLEWIKRSKSLRVVRVNDEHEYGLRASHDIVHVLQLQIFQAMAKNGLIQEFVSSYTRSSLTPALMAHIDSNPSLRSLTLAREWFENDDAALDLEATIRTIASRPTLQELGVPAEGRFLRPWKSCDTICDLTLQCTQHTGDTEFVLVKDVLETCTKLSRVELRDPELNIYRWGLIRSGLRANSSIAHFQLPDCEFLDETSRTEFLKDMQSSDTLVQHVRKLVLSGQSLAWFNCNEIVRMLCGGSLLEDLSLDLNTVERFDGTGADRPFDIARFFKLLIRKGSKVRMHSLHLGFLLFEQLPQVTAYIPAFVGLRSLALTVNLYYSNNWKLPDSLLFSLRSNGSLYTVNIIGQEFFEAGRNLPSAREARLMDAFTTRNRILPDLLASSLTVIYPSNPPATLTAPPLLSPTFKLVPALAVGSLPAERMAPGWLLKGLMKASSSDLARPYSDLRED